MQWQGEQAFLYIIRDVTKEKLREERLRMEANRDGLTQIGNRHYFLEKAGDMLKEESSLTFCYCDLDHLKYINDTFGHDMGNLEIRGIARFLLRRSKNTSEKKMCLQGLEEMSSA